MLIEDLRDWLLAKPAVSGLIDTRMYPDALEQGSVLPAADIEMAGTSHEHYLAGLAGLANSRVAIDCYAINRSGAHALAEAIMYAGLTTVKGVIGNSSISGIRLDEGPSDAVEEVDPATDDRRYVSTVVFSVHWAEQCN